MQDLTCRDDNGRLLPQVDLVVIDSDTLIAIECKSYHSVDDVHEHLERLAHSELSCYEVAPEREIPAPGLPLDQHFRRIQAANLALDATPYISVTTANIVLWAGLPLQGIRGETLSARAPLPRGHSSDRRRATAMAQ